MVVSTADAIAATLVNIGVIRVGVLVFDDSTCPFCVVTESNYESRVNSWLDQCQLFSLR